jgi:hypothetical protein
MATLITLSIKQADGKFKNYTISIYDQADQYGNNVAMYEEQTKEEREAKSKKTYLGNGKVVWTNGVVEVAPKKERTSQEAFKKPFENKQQPPHNIEYSQQKTLIDDIDDLPF